MAKTFRITITDSWCTDILVKAEDKATAWALYEQGEGEYSAPHSPSGDVTVEGIYEAEEE